MIKLSAPYVFDGEKFLCENSVVVLDERGFVLDVVEHPLHYDDVRLFDEGMLLPAFVNAHCHLELSYLAKQFPQAQGLPAFIGQMIAHPKPPLATIHQAIALHDQRMWDFGIQAVGDICNTPHTIATKRASPIAYHSFVECFEKIHTSVSLAQEAKTLLATFDEHTLSASCTPHAPYTLSPSSLADILSLASPTHRLLSIHYNESEEEKQFLCHQQGALFDRLSRAHGRSSIPCLPYNQWLATLPPKSHLLLVHHTVTDAEDLDFLERIKAQLSLTLFHCICIRANLYIQQKIPPLALIDASSIPWCIGTDSLASNEDLSILEEIKTLHFHFPSLPLSRLLAAATRQGAAALAMEERAGTFQAKRQSGAIHISGATNQTLSPKSKVLRIC